MRLECKVNFEPRLLLNFSIVKWKVTQKNLFTITKTPLLRTGDDKLKQKIKKITIQLSSFVMKKELTKHSSMDPAPFPAYPSQAQKFSCIVCNC